MLDDLTFWIQQYDLVCFVEISANNEKILAKLGDMVEDTHDYDVCGQTACFYNKEYKLESIKEFSNYTHKQGLYTFTFSGMRLQVLAVHLKARSDKKESRQM